MFSEIKDMLGIRTLNTTRLLIETHCFSFSLAFSASLLFFLFKSSSIIDILEVQIIHIIFKTLPNFKFTINLTSSY